MGDYELNIEKIFPTSYANIWTAELLIRSPEERISDNAVAHVMRVTVRFAYEDNGSVDGLLDAAYAKAAKFAGAVFGAMSESSMQAFRQAAHDRLAERNKPFEFSPDPVLFPGL